MQYVCVSTAVYQYHLYLCIQISLSFSVSLECVILETLNLSKEMQDVFLMLLQNSGAKQKLDKYFITFYKQSAF